MGLLSKNVLTALVHAQEAGDACAQNDKRGVPRNPRNPPGSATVFFFCISGHVANHILDIPAFSNRFLEFLDESVSLSTSGVVHELVSLLQGLVLCQ